MGGSQTNLDNRLDLMDFIDYHLLHDMDMHEIDYTWTNRRTSKDLIQVRLDRALISSDWFLKYKCSLSTQVRVGSDHYPIFLMADPLTFRRIIPLGFFGVNKYLLFTLT